jgi:hypothetical protein
MQVLTSRSPNFERVKNKKQLEPWQDPTKKHIWFPGIKKSYPVYHRKIRTQKDISKWIANSLRPGLSGLVIMAQKNGLGRAWTWQFDEKGLNSVMACYDPGTLSQLASFVFVWSLTIEEAAYSCGEGQQNAGVGRRRMQPWHRVTEKKACVFQESECQT